VRLEALCGRFVKESVCAAMVVGECGRDAVVAEMASLSERTRSRVAPLVEGHVEHRGASDGESLAVPTGGDAIC
jgi:hypothetical protein